MMCSRRCFVTLALLAAAAARAQTLAHPGWRGNGIVPEAWWKRAAFVRFGPASTFAQVTQNLEIIGKSGADSLVLPDLLGPADDGADAAKTLRPFRSRFGTDDDLDALLREASARRMHVLLRVDLLRLAGNAGELRFWMSRGIAGFDLGDVPPAQMDTVHLLRGSMDRFPGQRILLAHVPQGESKRQRNPDDVTLHVLSQIELTSPQGGLSNATEVRTLDTLQSPLPANATLIVDAALLTIEAARDDLRRALTARGRSYSSGRSARRKS